MGKFKSAVSKFFGGESDSFLWSPLSGFIGRNKRALLLEYKQLVYACVSTISEDVGRYDPIFYYEKEIKGQHEDVIVEHPFKKVLESPNDYMTQYDLFEATQSFLEITGNAFWYLEVKENSREPVAAHMIEPHRVEIKVNQTDGRILYYEISNYQGSPIRCEVDEIIHFKMFNPNNPYWGLGTVEAALLYIDTENEISTFQNSFMRNQATPSGVLSISGNISQEAFGKVKKQFKSQQSGSRNAGKILFTKADQVNFTKLGLSLSDLDMSTFKGHTQEEIRSMFRVPKAMLGASDESGLGRANVEAIEYSYAKRTIDPKLTRIDDTLRLYVRSAYKDPLLNVDHKSQIPADKEALRAQARELTFSVLVQNESRALFDLPPIEGGDQLYVPFNMTPIDMVTVEAPAAKQLGKMRIVTSQPALEKTSQSSYVNQLNRLHRSTLTSYEKTFKPIIEKQKKSVLTKLRNSNLVKAVEDYSSITPDETDSLKVFLASITPILVNAMTEGGTTAIKYVGSTDEFLLDRTLKDRILAAQTKGLKHFNRTTAEKIVKQLQLGLDAGENIEQLSLRIESVYSEATGYRARMIADTESNRAIVGATSDAYAQVGVSQAEWVTDGDPCPECQAMEGTIQDIGVPFILIGESIPGGDNVNDYLDVEGGDLHPNCNCKLVPVFDTEKQIKKEIVKVDRIVEVPDPSLVKELSEQKEYIEQLELIAGIADGQTETT